jgi:Na+/glutamate symporter
MVLWQRLLFTLIAMIVVSFLAGVIWQIMFNVRLPSYIGGLIGGMVAIPVWEFLKRVRSKGRR